MFFPFTPFSNILYLGMFVKQIKILLPSVFLLKKNSGCDILIICVILRCKKKHKNTGAIFVMDGILIDSVVETAHKAELKPSGFMTSLIMVTKI